MRRQMSPFFVVVKVLPPADMLQTHCRDQSRSPVNGVSALLCHVAPIDGHGMPGDK